MSLSLFMKMKFVISLLIYVLFPPLVFGDGVNYRLAVYYYPGWKDNAPGIFTNKPWDLIKKYPDREPLLGWYKEGDVEVMNQQLSWMKKYGINYVVFDWYWDGANTLPYLSHALDAYLSSANRNEVGFAIHWSNHRPFPYKHYQFDRMIQYLVVKILNQPGYWYDDDKPVVFIFSPDLLQDSASKIGTNTRQLLDRANNIAIKYGLKGIKFIANSSTGWGRYGPIDRGYSAMTGYVYRRAFSGVVEPYPENYKEMIHAYDIMWSWIINNMTIEYWPPVVFGWDKRPWGAVDKYDACCANTLPEFEDHLYRVKELVDSNPSRTRSTVLICCWNEYGEGNYIEPTKKGGFSYLESISKVFSTGVVGSK